MPIFHKSLYLRKVSVLVLAISFFIALNYLNYEMGVFCNFSFTVLLRRFADALMLALPIYFFKHKKFVFTYVSVVYFCIWIATMYLCHATEGNNIGNLLSGLRLSNLLLLVPLAGFIYYYRRAYSRIEYRTKSYRLSWFVLGLAVAELIIIPSYITKSGNNNKFVPYSEFNENNYKALSKYGITNYCIYTLENLIKNGVSNTGEVEANL